MKRFLIVFFLVMGIAGKAFTQIITIKDLVTHQPIELAAIFTDDNKLSVITSRKGQADISDFKNEDRIMIRVLGYEQETVSYSKLESSKFLIYLVPSNLTLDEVVISATRWQQDKRDVPSKITTIKSSEVLLENPQTAADLLGQSGEVFIQKSQLGGGSPMIRGFATNRVLITVDGIRMNNAIFRSGNLQNVISINPLAIQSTEVLYGPGAVMYGSDAIGGAINFSTFEPAFSSNGKPFVKGSVLGRWSSANMEKTGNFNFNLGFKKLAFFTSVGYSDFDDLVMGSNGPDFYLRPEYVTRINGQDSVVANPNSRKQINSGYSQMNLMQKVRWAPTSNLDLQYGFHYSATSDVPRYDRLIEYKKGSLRDGEWYYGPQVWMMHALNITHKAHSFMYDQVRFSGAYQFFEESRHNRGFGSSELTHRTENLAAYSASLDFDKKIGKKHTILYGAEYIGNNLNSVGEVENINSGEFTPTSSRYPDGSTWASMAAYMSYQIRINEKFTVQAGARYNRVLMDATFDTTYFDFSFTEASMNKGALTGSAGMAYRPNESWQFNMNLSTGFRAPNIDDMGKVFDSEPGAVIVPNPGLKPEYAYNGELGITKVFPNRLKIDVTGFYTLLDQAIVRREFNLNGQDSILYDGEMSQVLAMQNAASANIFGIQAGIELKIGYGISFISRFTWQDGEEELEDGSIAPLRHSVPWFGISRLSYKQNKLTAELYAQYQSEVSYDQLAPSEREKTSIYVSDANGNPYAPQWSTLNFKCSYQITDYLGITAGVENITDKRYRPYSSGITAAGRNFIVAIKGTF